MAEQFNLRVNTQFTGNAQQMVREFEAALRSVNAGVLGGGGGAAANAQRGGAANPANADFSTQIAAINRIRTQTEEQIRAAGAAGSRNAVELRRASERVIRDIVQGTAGLGDAIKNASSNARQQILSQSAARRQVAAQPLESITPTVSTAPPRPRDTRPAAARIEGGGSEQQDATENQQNRAEALRRKNADDEYIAASAAVQREMRVLAASVQETVAADRRYISATASAASARDRIAASALGSRDVGAAVDRRVAQRGFNAQVAGATNDRLAGDDNSRNLLAQEQASRTRLQAAVTASAQAEGSLADATLRLQRARAQLNADVLEAKAADDAYERSTLRAAAARDRQAGSLAEGRRNNADAQGASIESAYQRKLTTAGRDAEVASRILREDETIEQLATRQRVAQEQSARVTEAANRQAIAANGGSQIGNAGQATAFQRAQAGIAARQSGGVVDATRFQTGTQFVASRAFTTAGFALSGAALYGGVNALQSMVEQTEKLDEQFALLQQQFKATGDASEFQGFRNSILEIARDTGVTASDVATVAFQLKGAFGDTDVAIRNTAASMQLVRTTGLSVESITNNLTAISTAYGNSFTEVGDKVTALERRYGVLANQSFEAFGVVAAAAKQAGLSFDEVGEIIGVVGRASGRGADAIGESLNRILPAIQKNATGIASIYQQAVGRGEISQEQADQLTSRLAQGQTGKALYQIIQDQGNQNVSASTRNQLINALGGQREAQTIVPLFQGSRDIANGVSQDDSGALQNRFEVLAETLQQRLKQIGEEFRQLGVQLGEAGILDALKGLAGILLVVVQVLGVGLRAFNAFDDLMGNIPSKIVAVIVALKLLQLAAGGIRNLGGSIGGVLSGGFSTLGGRKSAATQAAETAAATAASAGTRAAAPVGTILERNRSGGYGEAAYGPAAPPRTGRGSIPTLGPEFAASTAASTAALQRSSLTFADRFRQSLNSGAENIRTTVQSAGRNFGNRLRQLGDFSASTVNGGIAGRLQQQTQQGTASRAGQVGAFITGGQGGLAGGVAAGMAGLFAVGSLVQLANTVQDTRKQNQSQVGEINKAAERKSLAQLQDLQSRGVFRDNVATSLGGTFGLNKKLDTLGDEQIGKATTDEFVKAMQNNLLDGNAEELEQLRKDIEKSKGQGEAGRKAREILAAARAKDQKRYDELVGEMNEQQASEASSGETNVQNIQDAATKFSLGQSTYTQYIEALTKNVDQLKGLAAGGDATALQNLKTAIDQRDQAVIQSMQAVSQLQQQANQAQGLTAQQSFAQQSRQVTIDAPVAPGAVRSPGLTGAPAVYDTQALKAQRLQQLTELQASGQQALGEAISNGAGPDDLARLEGAFSLTPEQVEELKRLQLELYGRILNLGGVAAGVDQVKQARQNAFQIATAQSQARVAGLYDPAAINRENANLAQRALADAQAGGNPVEIEQAKAGLAQQARAAQDTADAVAASRLQLQGARVAQDPLAAARNQVAQGQLALSQARGDEAKANAARGQIVQGQQALVAAQKSLAAARINLLKAQAGDDPVRQAQLDQQAARDAIASARSDEERINGQAQLAQANFALKAAQKDIGDAKINLLKAQAPDNALRQAQLDQELADNAARNAQGDAARLNAQAQRVAADQAVQKALDAIADSRLEVLSAQASSTGDTVRVAEIGLQKAQDALNRARSRGAGVAELQTLQAQVINAQQNLSSTTLQNSLDFIDFQLEMGDITTSQAIAMYEAQLQNAKTVQEQRQLMQTIKRLRDQLNGGGAGSQFNLPTTLGLPTLYTARRLAQETGQDGRVYGSNAGNAVTNNDNRSISIVLQATNAIDGQKAVATIVDALNEAPRYGTSPRLY